MPFLCFHVPAQEGGYGLGQLVLALSRVLIDPGGKQHQSQYISLTEDGGRGGGEQVVAALANWHSGVSLASLVNAASLHELLQLRREGTADELPLARAGGGDDAVPVGDNGSEIGGAGQGVAELGGKVLQAADEGILLKNDLSVPGGEDLQRVALTDPHGAADLLGDYHPAQVVCLCQSGAKNFCEVPKNIENTRFFNIWDFQKCKQTDQ